MMLNRCWNTSDPLYIKYHDEEWGVPLHDDQKLFEFLALEGFQAGLTWQLILHRREVFRQAFEDFNPKKIALYSEEDVKRIIEFPGVIRNRAKILSVINNARLFLQVQEEFGSFDAFIWSFVGGKTVDNAVDRLSNMPSQTAQSQLMSKELKRRGFGFVGPTICYAHMQATGMVNDHLISCFRYRQIQELYCSSK
jgi:DNA-3-methyladenine glycosylase I